MRIFLCLLGLCALASCSSPDQQFERLKQQFITEHPKQDLFENGLEKAGIRLPLPPSPEGLKALKIFVETCKSKAYEIELDKLSPENQLGLQRFRAALDSLGAQRSSSGIDPQDYTLAARIKELIENKKAEALLGLLEKIPVYYENVYQRWSAPEQSRIKTAVASSMLALDELDKLEQQNNWVPADVRPALQQVLPPARSAIRDYIGLCLSGHLN
ncbi:MAG: hypothetical protein WCR52_21110 [Bacteroidota bacterium]